jgi:hypothetical protein
MLTVHSPLFIFRITAKIHALTASAEVALYLHPEWGMSLARRGTTEHCGRR